MFLFLKDTKYSTKSLRKYQLRRSRTSAPYCFHSKKYGFIYSSYYMYPYTELEIEIRKFFI